MRWPRLEFRRARLLRLTMTVLVGLAAGQLAAWLRSPLPWMIGPLLATAALSMAGQRPDLPGGVRNGGQVVLGVAMGLYFTPVMVQAVFGMVHWVLLNVLAAWLIGVLGARLLVRTAKVDPITAYFGMMVGGGVEMAVQAERVGGRVDQVMAAHVVRVVMVVLIVPFAYKLLDVHGHDPLFVAQQRGVQWGGVLLLLGLAGGLTLWIARLRFPNVWVIVPLLLTALLTGLGIEWSVLPSWLVNLAQTALGVSMGTRFTPEFLRRAPRFLAWVVVGVLAMLAAASAFGYGFGLLSGVNVATTILAAAPGGVTEMSLTAKVLQLGVPMVTVFQVARMMLLVLLAGPSFRLYAWLFMRQPAVGP